MAAPRKRESSSCDVVVKNRKVKSVSIFIKLKLLDIDIFNNNHNKLLSLKFIIHIYNSIMDDCEIRKRSGADVG